MQQQWFTVLCILFLLGGCSGGGSDNAETVADAGSTSGDNAGGGEGEGEEGQDGGVNCTPAPVGTTMVTRSTSALTDGCISDEPAISLVPANRDEFNFSLDTSGYSSGDGNAVKGIHLFSKGGGISLLNPYWLVGETEYTYSGAMVPVVHSEGGYYLNIGFGSGFELVEFNELNLDIAGTVGDPQIGSIKTVEINWALTADDVSSSAKVSRRLYEVSGMPGGIVYATGDNPQRHLTWLLAQDIDERLLAMYDLPDNCTAPGLFRPRMPAQLIDATGQLGQAYVKSEHEVRYTVDVSTTHRVFTVDWDYLDSTSLTRLIGEETRALAIANGCSRVLAAPEKNDYAVLRQRLLSGALSSQANSWVY